MTATASGAKTAPVSMGLWPLRKLSRLPAASVESERHRTAAAARAIAASITTKVASPAGLRLVPDLAIALPTPTAGGTLYTFRLRNGIRYSDGRPLRASDFRRAMERLFQLGSPGAGAFLNVLGADRCRKGAHCDFSRGVRSDDANGTVSFRLRAPDPDFLFKFTSEAFTAPVPPGTPPNETGTKAIPATGPYHIVRANRREVRFERNPSFHEWSYAARPDGNPDAIVWQFVPTIEDAIAQVEDGHADWLFGLLPPRRPAPAPGRAASAATHKPDTRS